MAEAPNLKHNSYVQKNPSPILATSPPTYRNSTDGENPREEPHAPANHPQISHHNFQALKPHTKRKRPSSITFTLTRPSTPGPSHTSHTLFLTEANLREYNRHSSVNLGTDYAELDLKIQQSRVRSMKRALKGLGLVLPEWVVEEMARRES